MALLGLPLFIRIKEPKMILITKPLQPISIVATVAKILEKHVKSHILNHSITNNLLSTSQSACIKNHSTQTALLCVIDKCMSSINNQNFFGSFDISLGFET